jgi:hypothetical protein
MMSSVIPARLEFQCGHAALVSLPKIKNESSARRNERIAQEKVDARGRRCDFCGPLVTEVVAAPVSTNGHNGTNGHHATPPKPVAAVSIVAVAPEPTPTPVEIARPVVASAPVAPAPKPVVAAPKPVVAAPKPVVLVRTPHPRPLPEGEKVATRPVVAAPKPVAAAKRRGVAAKRAAGNRYVVRFRVEQVVQATDLRDALRQVSSLGAVEVLAITAR